MSADQRFLVPIVDGTIDVKEPSAELSFLTFPAPDGMTTVSAGTPLIPLFSTDEAALRMDVDPASCVRPRLADLIEVLGEERHVVLDAGSEPTLVLQLGVVAQT